MILRNARIDMFRGSMRLAVDQWGKIEETTGDFTPKVIIRLVSGFDVGLGGDESLCSGVRDGA